MRLGHIQPARIKLTVDVATIIQFFTYRQGPQFETYICSIELDTKAHHKLHNEFDKCNFKIDNHISWLQEDGLLYVYTDGRLNIGTPRLNTLMFEQ